jgi:hypothetical protein
MEGSKELVDELLIETEGAPIRKYNLDELVPWLSRGRFQTDGRTDGQTIGRCPRGRP